MTWIHRVAGTGTGLAIMILSIACGRGSLGARSEGRSAAPTTSTYPSPCPAPALTPGYLPEGMEPIDHDAIFGMPERLRTWKNGDILVQLGEGFSGDHGEEPRLKQVTVRQDDTAHLVPMEDPGSGNRVIEVDWAENTRCGYKQYLVVTKGLSEDETLKIAQSLEGSTT